MKKQSISALLFLLTFSFLCSLPANGQGWVARHNLSSSQYQAEFNKWTKQGYRLTQVSGFRANGSDRFNAIFEQSPIPAWEARHGLSPAQYQTEFDKLIALGFRPSVVSGYASANGAKYAAIFIKTPNSPKWAAKHGLNAADYQKEFDKMKGKGFQLTDISGYNVGGADKYAAIWEETTEAPQWQACHGLNAADYQKEFDKWVAQGYYLYKVSAYAGRYAAIWRKGGPAVWQARHGIAGSRNYQDEFERLFYQGYRPIWVNGASVNNKDEYAGIWVANDPFSAEEMREVDAIVKQYMTDKNVPGLSFAISRDGRLVLAKTYGYADKEAGELTAPRHRFRIASVSKPITSVTIMHLIAQGRLSLNDRVFGTNAILGNTYGAKAYTQNIKDITIDHLLTHTAGGWPSGAGDPMFEDKSWSMEKLIGKTLDDVPQTNAPGTNDAYSNFGYCILGRVIQKKANISYASYVKNTILRPCGISKMDIGGNTLAFRKADEVKYYGPGAPYNMNVNRMDAHGGWIASPIDLLRFINRVDRFNTVPDILSNASIDEMIRPTAVSGNNYAKGWMVNGHNYEHNGALDGTISRMVRMEDGFCWAVVTNSRPMNDGNGDTLRDLMVTIRNVIHHWPGHDLF